MVAINPPPPPGFGFGYTPNVPESNVPLRAGKYIDFASKCVDLKALKSADSRYRGDLDIETTCALLDYYRDTATSRTVARLLELGVGIPQNRTPLQVSLLRYAIDRQAVTYSNPPARWLRKDGRRLAESNEAHKLLVDAYETSQMDLAWREADRLRTCVRSAVLRFYPVDELGRIEVRIFTPDNVLRDPNPAVGHVLSHDQAFALHLSGDRWEVWEKNDAGWDCVWVDKKGEFTLDQPFEDYISPYDKLPALVTYDSFTGGVCWPSPRQPRVASIEAINGIANDLWQIVRTEAHSLIAWLGVRAQDLPKERGPGAEVALPGTSGNNPAVQVVSANPKLAEASDVLDQMVRQFLLSEDLPVDDLEKGAPAYTGAALKTRLHGLIERRKSQAPLASVDEQTAFEAFRSVHNYHASAWGSEKFPEDVRIEVEIAPIDLPVDSRELVEVGSRDLALGLASRIDLIMRERSISRAQAVRVAEQVDEDLVNYPVPIAPDAAMTEQAGPRTATAPDIVLDADGQDSKESVMDALRNPQG